MARKSSGGRPPHEDGSKGTIVPVRGIGALVPSPAGEDDVYREPGVTAIVGQPYTAGSVTILADAVFHVDAARLRGHGPWLGEADKIAWRDPETGYECIVMRDTSRGHLGGYVGVPASHPLYGFAKDAVPAELGIEIHGGLSYARICDDGPAPARRRLADEARRICHSPPRYAPLHHATGYRVEDAQAWWFGFSCDQLYDLVPGDPAIGRRVHRSESGRTYRDEAYVMREVLELARQLRAVADGVPMPPRAGPPPPAIGLDPERER